MMGQISDFCRERQAICHKAESVPQVAVLYSSAAFYRQTRRLFSAWDGELHPMYGVLIALLNSQYHVDVLSEHHLIGRMKDYPLIVIPEWGYLDKAFRKELLEYVRQGGKLLVIGAKAVPLFAKELGIQIHGAAEEKRRWLEIDGGLAGVSGLGLNITPKAGTQVLARWFEWDDFESPSKPVAVSRKFGKGEIVGLAVNFGERYRFQRTAQARALLASLTKRLFPKPLVTVTGTHELDLVVMKKNGKLLVNLLNTSGPHDNKGCYTFDEVTPLGPLTIEIQAPQKPKSIRLQPEGRPLAFQWNKGKTTVTLPRLELHSVLDVT
jgi:hypothetical protein